MTLPWNDPNHDVLADFREAYATALLKRGKTMKCVTVFSGGLDSTTLVHSLAKLDQHEQHLLSFDYGQRHKKELEYAARTADLLGLRHDVIDLSGITHLISNSALTSPTVKGPKGQFDSSAGPEIEVPEGHYAEESMKQTVVPNRNMIMLSIAAGVAVSENADCIATAVHAGDHYVYPDCRPEFIQTANDAISFGNEGFGKIPKLGVGQVPDQFILAPFIHTTKAEIAYYAIQLSVPLHMTWSCYKGGHFHCGRCGTCVERLEAISEAEERARAEHIIPDGIHSVDDTVYEDDEYWKQVNHG